MSELPNNRRSRLRTGSVYESRILRLVADFSFWKESFGKTKPREVSNSHRKEFADEMMESIKIRGQGSRMKLRRSG